MSNLAATGQYNLSNSWAVTLAHVLYGLCLAFDTVVAVIAIRIAATTVVRWLVVVFASLVWGLDLVFHSLCLDILRHTNSGLTGFFASLATTVVFIAIQVVLFNDIVTVGRRAWKAEL